MRKAVTSAGILAGLLITSGVWAQDTTASGQASTTGQANVGMSLPGSQPATATAGYSDHDQVVGRLAVGYFGITNVGAGAGGGAGSNDSPYSVTGFAPVVGVRYWINPTIGLDLGVGLSIVGGSLSNETPPAAEVDIDRNSFTGFILHGGVPIALASVDHFSFQVIPEANVGFTGASSDPNGGADGDVSHSGFHLDVGARVGAEIHFGFMKLPQLSLIGSVGLRLDMDSGSTTDSTGPGGDVDTKSSRTELHTTVGANPWAVFTNQVAALYYF
jgi:hypothetical protein